MNILLVYPEFPDTFWSFKHALKFISKKSAYPPLGLVTVAAMLPQHWNKKLVDLNVSSLSLKDLKWADYVFISAMVVQRKSVQNIISRCKKTGVKIVAGGPLFTDLYEDFENIDHFVLNEAELTLPLFLEDLDNGCAKRIYSTTEHAELSKTPTPMWELVDLKHYHSVSIQSNRGCPYNCDFCNITALLGHKVRTKSSSQILAELDHLYELGWKRNIFFVDDNFIGNKKKLKQEILPALIEWRKNNIEYNFITEASINLADDEELMHMMTRAGFISVFVGIESPDEINLVEAKKSPNLNRNLIDSVKKIHENGIQVQGGFIVGFDNDTPSIFQRQIDLIQNSGVITAMVGLLGAIPGTRLYDRLKKENRLQGKWSGDNVDGTTNFIPKMDIDVLKNGYNEILARIYSPKLFYARVKTFLSDFNPPHIPFRLYGSEILAFVRSIIKIGIFGKERFYYWDLLLWSLLRHPRKFYYAVTFSIYGYHLRLVSEQHLQI